MVPALLVGDSEAQRGIVNCLRSHSKKLAALRVDPGILCCVFLPTGVPRQLSQPGAHQHTAVLGDFIQPDRTGVGWWRN